MKTKSLRVIGHAPDARAQIPAARQWRSLGLGTLVASLLAAAATGWAAERGISYQGKLFELGSPASGTYDFRFILRDAETGAEIPGGSLGQSLSVSSGAFSTTLQFPPALFASADLALEIWVRKTPEAAGGAAGVPDAPYWMFDRQPIQAVPYSFRAQSADTARTVTSVPVESLPATVPRLDAAGKLAESTLPVGVVRTTELEALSNELGLVTGQWTATAAGLRTDLTVVQGQVAQAGDRITAVQAESAAQAAQQGQRTDALTERVDGQANRLQALETADAGLGQRLAELRTWTTNELGLVTGQWTATAAGLRTDLTLVQGQVAQAGDRITAVQAESAAQAAQQGQRTDALTERVDGQGVRLAALETADTAQAQGLAELRTWTTAELGTVTGQWTATAAGLRADLTAAQGQVSQLGQQVATAAADSAAQAAQLGQLGQRAAALQEQADGQGVRLAALETADAAQAQGLAELRTWTTAELGTVTGQWTATAAGLRTDLTAAQGQVSQLGQQVATAAADSAAQAAQLGQLGQRAAALQEQADGQGVRLAALETADTAQAQGLAELRTGLAGLAVESAAQTAQLGQQGVLLAAQVEAHDGRLRALEAANAGTMDGLDRLAALEKSLGELSRQIGQLEEENVLLRQTADGLAALRRSGWMAASLLPQDPGLLADGFLPVQSIPAPDWVTLSTAGAPTARSASASVWTGQEWLVWGGKLGGNGASATGGRYRPDLDQWSEITPVDAPSARSGHSAVWTGVEMIVWGGLGDRMLATGARYRPAPQAWTPLATEGAPAARVGHGAVWTGTRMIVFGGRSASGLLGDGGAYDPATDAWTSLPTEGAPSPRTGATTLWTGDSLLVWGGDGESGEVATGALLSFAADGTPGTWKPISTQGGLSPRAGQAAVWNAGQLLVWGGRSPFRELLADGAIWDAATDVWVRLPTSGAPSARQDPVFAWTGSEFLVWGGEGDPGRLANGAAYRPETATWRPLGSLPAASARSGALSAWTGTDWLIVGGLGAAGTPVADPRRLEVRPPWHLYRRAGAP